MPSYLPLSPLSSPAEKQRPDRRFDQTTYDWTYFTIFWLANTNLYQVSVERLAILHCCSSVVVNDDQGHHVEGDWVWSVRLWLISLMRAQKALPQVAHRWSAGTEVRTRADLEGEIGWLATPLNLSKNIKINTLK